jgi:hypothetical protein
MQYKPTGEGTSYAAPSAQTILKSAQGTPPPETETRSTSDENRSGKKASRQCIQVGGIIFAAPHQEVSPETFGFSLCKDKLRKVRRQEGQYLLRSNLIGEDAAVLWKYYIQLVEVEQAFKTLKNDLSLRPIYHQKDLRIEAHIFVALLSYCLQVTLQQRLKALAPGLTVRSILEKSG